MSIRTALIGAMLAVGVLATAVVGGLGVWSIGRTVVHEAQERVNHDLDSFRVYGDGRLRRLVERVEARASTFAADAIDLSGYLARARDEEGIRLLNACDLAGRPMAGEFGDAQIPVPVREDPVLRRAALGQCAAGIVRLDAARLAQEGGEALRRELAVRVRGSPVPATTAALFWWVACPLRNGDGRPAALLYGGRPLNHEAAIVDEMRELAFGSRAWGGKPEGTVTIFLDDVRVSTNVLDRAGQRALGTRVSPQVREAVLGRGQTWRGRAWVVDAWYLSAYEPLRDPDGTIVGMLYLGLLEAPYDALRTDLILRFLAPVGGVALLALLAAFWIGRRIARPIRRLAEAARHIAAGKLDTEIGVLPAFAEIAHLAGVLANMQRSVADQDRQLREGNRRLAEQNERIERTNRNYMQMLGFITHELKSPLAAMQGMIFGLIQVPEPGTSEHRQRMLERIDRTCEELQDMVRNYLDLSRVERGELVAKPREIDFRNDVVHPVVRQCESLFEARGMTLEVECPLVLPVRGDPELLRIALTNLVNNAAKYGRDGGQARIEVRRAAAEVVVEVRNEGAGFTPTERDTLFTKFSRLANEATRTCRGSGLGLFLCRQVLRQHEGRVWAESEPGAWACFGFAFPASGEGMRGHGARDTGAEGG